MVELVSGLGFFFGVRSGFSWGALVLVAIVFCFFTFFFFRMIFELMLGSLRCCCDCFLVPVEEVAALWNHR